MLEANRYKAAVTALTSQQVPIKLIPDAGSPIAELVKASDMINPWDDPTKRSVSDLFVARVSDSKKLNDVDELANRVEWASSSEGTGSVAMHSAMLDSKSTDFAKIVSAHLNYAKNVVAPVTDAFILQMQEALKAMQPSAAEEDFKIAKAKVPAVLLDETFLNMGLASYLNANNPAGESLPYAGLSCKTVLEYDYYLGMMNVGNERINLLIKEWLAGLPEDFLRYVFYSRFAYDYSEEVQKTGEMLKQYDRDWRRNNYTMMDEGLAVFLMADWMYNNPVPDDNLSLDQYRSKLIELKQAAGAQVTFCMKQVANQINLGVMVAEANMRSKTILVNEELYKKFLVEGGSPEILLGMLASGQIQYGVQQIMAKAEVYRDSWRNYVTLSISDRRAKLISSFESYMREAAVATLGDLTPSEKEYVETECPNYVENVTKLIDFEMQKHRGKVAENLIHISIELMAKCRFYHTAAYDFLSAMEKARLHNPDITANDAAFLAECEYVAGFLAYMLKPVKG